MAGAEWEQPAGRRSPPVVPAALALAVVAGAVVWALGANDDAGLPVEAVTEQPTVEAVTEQPMESPDPDAASGPPTPTVRGPRDSATPGPWRLLPHSPLVRRTNHSVTWTGEEVIVWGGSRPDPSRLWDRRTHLASGAAFDPGSERWRRIAPAPIPPRDSHSAAWTGEELLVWGGRAAGSGPAGAAYRPDGGHWRVIAAGPLDERAAAAEAAWTGSRLLAWVHDGDRVEVATYDPSSDAWRSGRFLTLPAPARVRAVLAGSRLVAWVTGSGGASSVHRYDPGADTWQAVDAPALPSLEGLAAAGDTVVAWGHRRGEHFGELWAAMLDGDRGEVRPLMPPPTRLGPDPVAAWTGTALILWDGADGAVLDPAAQRWSHLTAAPLRPRAQASGTWTGRELVVWGGGDDEGFHADGARMRPALLPAVQTRVSGPVAQHRRRRVDHGEGAPRRPCRPRHRAVGDAGQR